MSSRRHRNPVESPNPGECSRAIAATVAVLTLSFGRSSPATPPGWCPGAFFVPSGSRRRTATRSGRRTALSFKPGHRRDPSPLLLRARTGQSRTGRPYEQGTLTRRCPGCFPQPGHRSLLVLRRRAGSAGGELVQRLPAVDAARERDPAERLVLRPVLPQPTGHYVLRSAVAGEPHLRVPVDEVPAHVIRRCSRSSGRTRPGRRRPSRHIPRFRSPRRPGWRVRQRGGR